jgi:hypothetical protein
MRIRRTRQVRRVLVLLVLLSVLCAAGSDTQWTKCIRSVPRRFSQSQKEQLCVRSSVRQDPTAPGRCAKLALGGRALQSAKFALRIELLRAASIVQLCSGTHNTGPAKCWLAIPAQVRQQMFTSASPSTEVEVESEAATMPLIQICRRAQDERPAQCWLLWLEMGRTLRRRDTHDNGEMAAALCRDFGGEVAALKQCVKQVAPHLGSGPGADIGKLQLCQPIGDGSHLPAVVECASKLGRKHIVPSTIVQVCAGTSEVAQPHICFLEAQLKLRWMDHDAQISLCRGAFTNAATTPILCAVEMKASAQKLQPSESSTAEFVANLCRGTTNATTVGECVRLLPAHTFTAEQALRLCAASKMPASEESASALLYPTTCASQARVLLQRALLGNSSNELGLSASAAAVLVCEQATSDAPSKCLADTQQDQDLSFKLRVELCQRATSDAPQRCVKLLRTYIRVQRLGIKDAVVACRQTESLGPVECVTELLQGSPSVAGHVASQLCQAARNLEPARCFNASPLFYDDDLKLSLCSQAESSAPASCVESVITRLGNQPSVKVALCRGAATSAPAACAVEAPFGMDASNVVVLCRSAVSTAPARCANEVSTALSVPWHRVAQVCAGASSTTPGRCLAYHIRHSRLLHRALDDTQVVIECRQAVARPAALSIAQASYNCPELRPRCPLQLVVNMLDQYGDPKVERSSQIHDTDVVYVTAAFLGRPDQLQDQTHGAPPSLQGPSYAPVIHGSAVFSNLLFTGAGEFTLTIRAGEGVTEEVARVLVHPDLAAEALQRRCDELFTRFQCSARSPPPLTRHFQRHELQALLLPRPLHINGISCGQFWFDNVGGLAFNGFSSDNSALYTLPRPLYDLFTYVLLAGYPILLSLPLLINASGDRSMDVPRADMSAWALLGLAEGETNGAAIRRAYHRRSLEWHPDKWHALAAALPPVWQQELSGVFALVAQAYDQLKRSISQR